MEKQQRMVQMRQYLHDVHGRVGDPGWHRIGADDLFYNWALVVSAVTVVALAVLTRV